MEHLPVPRLSGELVGKQGGHHCLTVHPPQFHPPVQLRWAVATHVQEVEQPPMLMVKTICIWLLNELLNGRCLDLVIAPVIMKKDEDSLLSSAGFPPVQ